jgi:hypothetical protein
MFFEKTKQMLQIKVQMQLSELMTHNLLCTYLGEGPGVRAHKGF